MTSINELFTKWDKAQSDANISLESVPSNILPGMTIRKTRATAELEVLKTTYRTLASKTGIGIVVVGSESKGLEYGSIGEEEGGGVTVNGRELYTRIAQRVNETFGNAKSSPREFGYIQFNALVAELSEVGRELGLDSIPRPAVPAALILPTYDAVYAAMRKIVRGVCGDDLNIMYTEKKALDLALTQRYDAPVLPVYIAGVEDTQEAQNFYTRFMAKNNVVVNVIEETVDRNLVVGTLNTIKKTLSTKKTVEPTSVPKKKYKTKPQDDDNNEQQ